MSIPTPHIEAINNDNIAKTILMPGDPLRAKYISETFLEDVNQFNSVRGMNGYTGKYNGKKISVMASGMGMPSIGIYSFELYKFYGVENIIRIGSCGSYTETIKIHDILLVEDAWSESTYAKVQSGYENNIMPASVVLNEKILKNADKLDIDLIKGRVHSSDVFYRQKDGEYKDIRETYGCLAVEMESFALFSNARVLGKNAACILTVSDSFITGEAISSEDRKTSFTNMMKVALELAE